MERSNKISHKPAHSGTTICVGDKVKIINPKINQAQYGVIVGITKSGFVKVESGDKKSFTDSIII